MARRKKHHPTVRGSSTPPEIPIPIKSRQDMPWAKLDLATLLAETPEHSIDFEWEAMPPAGRELR